MEYASQNIVGLGKQPRPISLCITTLRSESGSGRKGEYKYGRKKRIKRE